MASWGWAAVVLLSMLTEAACADAKYELQRGENSSVSIAFLGGGLKEPLKLGVSGDSGIYFEDAAGRHALEGKPTRETVTKDAYFATWNTGRKQVDLTLKKISGGFSIKLDSPDKSVGKWGVALDLFPDEFITGLMERVVDGNQNNSWRPGMSQAMDLHGEKVTMAVERSLSLYTPFYLSSRGYGLFVQGTWPGSYDFGHTDENVSSIVFEGTELVFEITTSSSPASLVQQNALRVGPSIVPPKWAFGHWRWRDNHHNRSSYYDNTPANAPYNSDLVEDVLMMQALDIPCSVYWIDRPWAVTKGGSWLESGFSDYEWDPQRLPDARGMIQWLEAKGIRTLLWIAPWVAGDMNRIARERGYDLEPKIVESRAKNMQYLSMIDFTNPEAVRWWKDEGPGKVLKDGIKGFKLDRADVFVPNDPSIVVHDGRTARENANDYPRQYVQATHEIAQEIHGDDFVLLPRAGYTGSTRYAAFWGGDTAGGPWGLRSAIIAQLRASIIGFPIWGSDTGGYPKKIERENCARWLGFSCFSPIMEVGPTGDAGFWNMKGGPKYDAELLAIWRLYAQLHTQLIDYSHACALEANETGMPIVRPLFLAYPDQPEAWKDWQTYLYGPDLLVSAIWENQKTSHRLYLPGGDEWIDAWNPEKIYKGGVYIEVDTPMHKIPIFVRKGATINLPDLNALYRKSVEICGKKPDLKKMETSELFK